MSASRGKTFALSTLAAGLVVLLAAGLASRQWILAEWHAWRFRSADDAARWELARQLEVLGPKARAAAEAWYIEKLKAVDEKDQVAAEERLSEMTSLEAVPFLLTRFRGNPGERERLQKILKACSGEVIPILVRILCDENVDEDQRLIWPFTLIGRQAVPALLDVLRGPNPRCRGRAAQALWMLRDEAIDAVPSLIAALKDEDSNARYWAVSALAGLGPAARSAEPALLDLLKGHDDAAGSEAISALRSIGTDPERIFSALIAAVKNASHQVRVDAIYFLSDDGSRITRVVDKLVAMLEETDDESRQAALVALGSMGSQATRALPSLRKASNDADKNVRDDASRAIEKILGSEPRRP